MWIRTKKGMVDLTLLRAAHLIEYRDGIELGYSDGYLCMLDFDNTKECMECWSLIEDYILKLESRIH
jgi:hypothetical protein